MVFNRLTCDAVRASQAELAWCSARPGLDLLKSQPLHDRFTAFDDREREARLSQRMIGFVHFCQSLSLPSPLACLVL